MLTRFDEFAKSLALLDDWQQRGPLEERVKKLRHKYAGDKSALDVLDREQRDIDMYRKYRRWYGSAYFVMQASS